jgi:hypothetical protein
MIEQPRKLRRNDVVLEKDRAGFTPARVWRRIDEDRVQIITVGQHVKIMRDDELVLCDYKGRWHVPKFHGRKRQERWLPMTSLRRLKQLARRYNPHFGGHRYCGHKWTKSERQEALANRSSSKGHYDKAEMAQTSYSNRMIHIDTSADFVTNVFSPPMREDENDFGFFEDDYVC